MPSLDNLVWPFAMVYLVVVTLIGAGLIVFGFLLSRAPGVPTVADRTYTEFMMRLLYALVRPFDFLSPEMNDG